jgi:hypothetical protein
MPNHCYQQVHIYGPRFLVKELYEHLSKEEPQFCQVIKPMPFDLSSGLHRGPAHRMDMRLRVGMTGD